MEAEQYALDIKTEILHTEIDLKEEYEDWLNDEISQPNPSDDFKIENMEKESAQEGESRANEHMIWSSHPLEYNNTIEKDLNDEFEDWLNSGISQPNSSGVDFEIIKTEKETAQEGETRVTEHMSLSFHLLENNNNTIVKDLNDEFQDWLNGEISQASQIVVDFEIAETKKETAQEGESRANEHMSWSFHPLENNNSTIVKETAQKGESRANEHMSWSSHPLEYNSNAIIKDLNDEFENWLNGEISKANQIVDFEIVKIEKDISSCDELNTGLHNSSSDVSSINNVHNYLGGDKSSACDPTNISINGDSKLQNTKSIKSYDRNVALRPPYSTTPNDVKMYKCNLCQTEFLTEISLTSHMLSHRSAVKFTCDVCRKEFTNERYMDRHMFIHSGIMPFKCDTCPKDFRWKYQLTKHMLTHNDKTEKNIKPLQCYVCQEIFTDKSTMLSHLLTHNNELFKNDSRQKQIKYKTNLTSQKLSESCKDPQLFNCNICKKSFTVKDSLIRHMSIHDDTTKFKCNSCQKEFSFKKDLTSHILSHNRKKSFKCDPCEKEFSSRKSLTCHMLSHLGTRPFECES